MEKPRSGTVKGTVSGTIEKDGLTVEYTAKVSGSYYYDPGCMYLKNGDPGYPPEEDYEGPFFEGIDELDVGDDTAAINQEDYKQLIQDDVEINKSWDDCEWDDDPEPPEPPEDDL